MKKLIFFTMLFSITFIAHSQIVISGKVLTDDGKSPENVKVVFKQIAPSTSLDSVYTNSTGIYSISLTKGVYDLSYSKIGYDPQNITSQSFYANKTLVDITLKASAKFDLNGNIKGILNIGTYNSSNITVAEGDSLYIAPGVVINFLENCTFQIKGKLFAIGSTDKPIKFTSLDITKKWSGALLSNSQSKLENIIIEQSNSSGLQIDNGSNVALNKLTIQNNHNGVTLHNSKDIVFNKCSFLNNNDYGGLTSESSSLKVYHCIFISNSNVVHCPSSCYGFYAGGAINLAEWADGSNSLVVYNSIFKNNAGNYVINVNGSSGDNNTTKIANSIFYGNSASAVHNVGNCVVENSLFFNSGGVTSLDSWIGKILAKNENNEDCDIYYNIFNKDPLFVNVTNNDFNLANGSPCIDAGNVYADSLLYYDVNNKCRIADGNNDGREFVDMGLFEINSKFKTVIPISIGNDTLICRNSSTILTPDVLLGNYVWSTGETLSQITVKDQGEYSVCVSDDNNFGIAKKFILASSGLFAKDRNFNKGDIIYGSIYNSENPVVFADIDNDDDMDVIFETNDININSRLNWMRNDKGKFLFVESSFEASRFSNIAVSDIDNDGNIEIIVSMNDSIVVFSYKDNKLFNVKKKFLGSFRSIVDFNNDGLSDLYTTGSAYGSNWGVACINKGNLNFENITTPLIPATKWIDFDNDGYKDGFYKNRISKNNRNLTFTIDTVKVAPDAFISDIGDFNNDGLIDVISHNSEDISQVKISRNDGDCKFSDVPVAFNSTKDARFLPIDYNNDGMTDVFNQSDASIFENDGNFNFTKKETKIEIGGRSIKLVDLNCDNSSDIYNNGVYNFESVNGSDQIYSGQSFLNNECKKNTPPLPPTDVKVVLSGDTIKLTWNRGSDLEQGQNGLGYNFYIGSAPGKDDIVGSNSNLATGFRKIADYGNASLNTFAIIVRNLPTGKYYVAVQSIDNSFIGSKFSQEVSFTTKCNIILTTNSTVGGNVSGGGSYDLNTVQTVTAIANTGYTFTNWTENGTVVSTSASYTFTVLGNRTLTANFTPTNYYTVTVSANPTAGGTVSGGGAFAYGTSQTIIAKANTGYVFNNWSENGVTGVSSSSSYTFIISSNRTLVATFTVAGSGIATLPVFESFSTVTTSSIGTLPNGFSQSNVQGYVGALKFATTGAYLLLHFDSSPGILSFDLGVNNVFPGAIPSTATFVVEESSDGVTWTNCTTYSNSDGGTKTISNLKTSSRYIRWTYSNKPSGTNIALKNISLTAFYTGIKDVSAENIFVYSLHKNIVIENAEEWNISVIDMLGRIIQTKKIDVGKFEIPVSQTGFYAVFLSKEGKACSRKVIVSK